MIDKRIMILVELAGNGGRPGVNLQHWEIPIEGSIEIDILDKILHRVIEKTIHVYRQEQADRAADAHRG